MAENLIDLPDYSEIGGRAVGLIWVLMPLR